MKELIDFNQFKIDIKNLPEMLADNFGIDYKKINNKGEKIKKEIFKSKDVHNKNKLLLDFIFNQFFIISSVQNGGDKGFLPELAKEVKGLDCTLSSWCMWDRLKDLEGLEINFGYPSGHSVLILTLFDESKLYVDSQNGIVFLVELKEVFDENCLRTAYPIYEITNYKQLSIKLDSLGEIHRVRKEGSSYIPKYLGIKKDGKFATLSNLFMLTNVGSPVLFTCCAKKFRAKFGIKELPAILEIKAQKIKNLEDKLINNEEKIQIVNFINECNKVYKNEVEPLVEKEAGGKVIQETKYLKLNELHHKEFQTK